MATTIDPKRLKRLQSKRFHLRNGKGEGINGKIDGCIMQAVDWLAGGDGATDRPDCASPVITDFCIRLNDSDLFAEHRDLLKPYAPRIVGTRDGNDEKRGYICVNYGMKVFIPFWLRQDTEHRFDALADECEQMPAVTDAVTLRAAKALARKVYQQTYANANAYAYAYANAYAYAYANAYAYAYAYANAIAYAIANAYAIAIAYAIANAIANAIAKKLLVEHGTFFRTHLLQCLDAMLDCK